MARTINEILQTILDAKAAEAELDVLDSTSQTAIWRLWAYVTAVAIWVHEKLWDAFRAEIEDLRNRFVAGTAAWYVDRALAFQYGDPLLIDPDTFQVGYEVIDPAKQIVTQAAVVQANGVATIKIAKGLPGSLLPLSSPELTAFLAYIDDVQFAGAQVSVLTANSDKLKLIADVYYDGVRLVADIQTDVEAAINAYLSGLDFNGRFLRNALIDAIQAVDGVTDVDIDTLEGRADAGSFAPIGRAYTSFAGYIAIDAGFPLSTNLNYIPE